MKTITTTPSTSELTGIRERLSRFTGAIQAKDLAQIFGVNEALIYKLARNGVMPNFRIGTLVRFDPKAVCEWYDNQKT